MKKYVRLYVEEEAFYSGQEYKEEVFLTRGMWDAIQEYVGSYVVLSELDGKHSETDADIDVEEWDEESLKMREVGSNDGEELYEVVVEALHNLQGLVVDENMEPREWLKGVQEEVIGLSEMDSMVITFNKKDREEIERLLEGYVL